MGTTRDEHNGVDPGQLYGAVKRCQESYAAWNNEIDPERREQLRAQHRALVERVWELLSYDLKRLARRWRRSSMAADTDSQAMSMFVHFITVLPKLDLDPSRNIRSFLLMIIQRDTIDEYRKTYSDGPRQRPGSSSSPDHSTQMWRVHGLPSGRIVAITAELIDPASSDAEARIAADVDRRQLLRAIWAYWLRELSDTDYKIVQLRWQSDPPLSFAEITQHLGSGWTEDAVRQRHHRVIKETKKYLQDRGLLE